MSPNVRKWLVLGVTAVLLGLAWFALSRVVGDPDDVAELARNALKQPAGVVLIPLGVAVGLLVFIPVTALFLGCALVFEPWQALLIGLVGSLLGAAGNWVIGRLVAGPLLEHLKGEKWDRLKKELQEKPFRATLVLRFFPVGGFTLLNMFAGAVRVPFGGYMLGNLVGLAPLLLLISFVGGKVPDLIREPSPVTFTLMAVGVAVFIGVMVFVKRLVRPAA
ncbi:MAG: hypothetical protein DI536_28265 [Archangium gephyra]|uniref:TVP38/TMEM64 family membrane protein n=1 Tax=Archangium gephyra TaxID=48 RepID=A0A2W5T4P6_9BACT|nr:MAG: hypothetical protein DI536_28265 [Archangium gephyra]